MTRHRPTAWIAAFALATTSGAAGATKALSDQGGCTVCHAVDKKGVGPSYKDIAARWKGKAGAPAQLAKNVREGSKGAWGTVPMPPTPAAKLNDADLKAVIDWVLATP